MSFQNKYVEAIKRRSRAPEYVDDSIEARMVYKFCVCVLQHSAEAPGRNEGQTSPLPGSIGRLAPGLAGTAGAPLCSLAPLPSFRRLSQIYRLWYADYCGQPITHQIPFVWMSKPRSRRKPYGCECPASNDGDVDGGTP